MSYTVRDALKFVYPIVWQHWATRAVGANQFIFAANHALNMIYNYQWFIWSWQHMKDIFILPSGNPQALRLVTRQPINTVDKFFSSNWNDIENSLRPCECEFDIEDVVCWTGCDCEPACTPVKLKKIRPQNSLCAGEFKVAWSELAGAGWLNGRIIHVYLQHPVEQLRVTYWRGVKHVTTFDEIVPLPDSFMTAFGYFIASIIVPMYGIMMQQQDLTYSSLARKQLDELKMADNDFPPEVRFNEEYPLESPKHR